MEMNFPSEELKIQKSFYHSLLHCFFLALESIKITLGIDGYVIENLKKIFGSIDDVTRIS